MDFVVHKKTQNIIHNEMQNFNIIILCQSMKPRFKEPTNQIIFTVYVMIKEKFSILIHNHRLEDYRDGPKPNIYPTRGEHDDHYTIDAI